MMKAIAERLSSESWPLIDVTLKQFSMPVSTSWSSDKEAYVLEMIADAADHLLIELAQHVGHQLDQLQKPRVDPPFWRESMFRLFISHLAGHKAFAAELQKALRTYGISAFVAHNDIEPTAEWQTQIETALATCDAMVALLHPQFHASNWTDQEIGYCMGRGVPVYSVKMGQDPYGFIGRFQAFNGHSKSAKDLATELFDAYRQKKETQQKMASVVVGLFERSASFSEAKLWMGFLEELDSWDPTYSTRLRSAAEANSQITSAWGVPERLKSLIGKWDGNGLS